MDCNGDWYRCGRRVVLGGEMEGGASRKYRASRLGVVGWYDDLGGRRQRRGIGLVVG